MQKYDYLIVGAGLTGAVLAHELTQAGFKCLVIDKKKHIGGACYTENIEGIEVHAYGPHIFHTNDKEVWDYINKFGKFHTYINQPIAISHHKTYNLPFNMNTFSKLFNLTHPLEVEEKLKEETKKYQNTTPKNLEEQALKLVGKTIYNKLIKEYTEKQWGRKCKDLPPEIITRIPIRLTYNNNYYNDTYQGIPTTGYTKIFKKLLKGIEVILNVDYHKLETTPEVKIIFTGRIDEYFGYNLGKLEYRSVNFDHVIATTDNVQGTAIFNYSDKSAPYTRSTEHRFFYNKVDSKNSVITFEKPYECTSYSDDAYYPINTLQNKDLYNLYKAYAKNAAPDVIFAGRLGTYKYMDMDDTIRSALDLSKEIINGRK